MVQILPKIAKNKNVLFKPLTFFLYFVCQRADFILAVSSVFVHCASFQGSELAICNTELSVAISGCKTLQCTQSWGSSCWRGWRSESHAPTRFKAVEPTFCRHVIPTISFAAHRTNHAVSPELVLKGVTGVLAAPVGVVHPSRCWILAEPSHGQRIAHDIRRHAWLERSAHDFAVKQIKHDSQVRPTGSHLVCLGYK